MSLTGQGPAMSMSMTGASMMKPFVCHHCDKEIKNSGHIELSHWPKKGPVRKATRKFHVECFEEIAGKNQIPVIEKEDQSIYQSIDRYGFDFDDAKRILRQMQEKETLTKAAQEAQMKQKIAQMEKMLEKPTTLKKYSLNKDYMTKEMYDLDVIKKLFNP